jgi:hypothetical protein
MNFTALKEQFLRFSITVYELRVVGDVERLPN